MADDPDHNPDPAARRLWFITLIRFAGLLIVTAGFLVSGAFQAYVPVQILAIILMLAGALIILFGPRYFLRKWRQ